MLSNLFINYEFWYSIAILCFILVLFFLFFKYETGRYILITALMFIALGSATYSGIQLYGYYGSIGGIYGSIFGIEDTEIVSKDMKFDFKNMELISTENSGEYAAKIESSDVFKIESNKLYGIFVNDTPCGDIEYTKDYAIAKYTYNFYDKNKNCLMSDTLVFNFSFSSKLTTFEINTNGGAEAMKYWNSYFNKNTFIVEIKPIDNAYVQGSEILVIEASEQL